MKKYSPTHRFHPFKEDFRNAFARDRDRIIHCSSFRRLEYKTQVFLNIQGDYFRTRLTHTLEVSQIARSISSNCGLDENLGEAIALAHDLGHSPFGHSGGDELDRILKDEGFSSGFDHNFQSFRIVTKLEKRYKHFDGLNLTFATLEGILKHSAPYEKYFFDDFINTTFSIKEDPRAEAMIVDLSDEIAYVAHDIDDGIKHKLIDFEILEDSSIVREIISHMEKENIFKNDKVFRYRFASSLINFLIENIISNYKKNKTIQYSPNIASDLCNLKDILFKNLYSHEEIVRKMFFGKLCIKNLFSDFMNDIRLLPKELRLKIDEGYTKHRVISDYIVSMTDRYAINIYKELHVG